MNTARERRQGEGVEIKLHVGSNITIYHDDDTPISVNISGIRPQGHNHYQVSGKGVADDEYYTFIIIR